MASQANKKKSTLLLIRRIVAIVLSIGAVVALFLPMLTISEDAQEAFGRIKTEDREPCKVFIQDLPYSVSRIMKSEGADKKYVRYLEDAVSDLVSDAVLPLYETGEDHKITFLDACTVAGIPSEVIGVLDAHADDLDEMLREFGDLEPDYREQETEIRSALDSVKTVGEYGKILPIVFYALFFLTLAFGIVSIVMCACNRSKIFVILFLVFALLCAALFVAMIVVPRVLITDTEPFDFDIVDIGQNVSRLADAGLLTVTTLLPGVGLILMPILSLASCIVYQRDRSYRGILPPREKTAAAPAAVQTVFEDTPKTECRPIVFAEENDSLNEDDMWVCPRCGEPNDPKANYCLGCGAVKPRVLYETAAPEVRYCRECGHKLTEGHRFCPACGAKIDTP